MSDLDYQDGEKEHLVTTTEGDNTCHITMYTAENGLRTFEFIALANDEDDAVFCQSHYNDLDEAFDELTRFLKAEYAWSNFCNFCNFHSN